MYNYHLKNVFETNIILKWREIRFWNEENDILLTIYKPVITNIFS